MTSDHYKILGITSDADITVIKKAYRKYAKQYHPDKNPGNDSAAQQFKEINNAYEVLKIGSERASYDRSRQQNMKNATHVKTEQDAPRQQTYRRSTQQAPFSRSGKSQAAYFIHRSAMYTRYASRIIFFCSLLGGISYIHHTQATAFQSADILVKEIMLPLNHVTDVFKNIPGSEKPNSKIIRVK